MTRERTLYLLRRATWAGALIGVLYLLWRFDSIALEDGASPIHRYGAGDRLVVDQSDQRSEIFG